MNFDGSYTNKHLTTQWRDVMTPLSSLSVSYLLVAISFLTCSSASRKKRSISVRCSRMFFASFFTLFISRVFRSTVRCSFDISTRDDSFSTCAFDTSACRSLSNSRTT